jgi:hypothetical protein
MYKKVLGEERKSRGRSWIRSVGGRRPIQARFWLEGCPDLLNSVMPTGACPGSRKIGGRPVIAYADPNLNL